MSCFCIRIEFRVQVILIMSKHDACLLLFVSASLFLSCLGSDFPSKHNTCHFHDTPSRQQRTSKLASKVWLIMRLSPLHQYVLQLPSQTSTRTQQRPSSYHFRQKFVPRISCNLAENSNACCTSAICHCHLKRSRRGHSARGNTLPAPAAGQTSKQPNPHSA